MTLGTILPTKRSLQISEDIYQKELTQRRKIAKMHLSQYEYRVVGGEDRYYNGNKYAIVTRRMEIRWFEVRKDGDYS